MNYFSALRTVLIDSTRWGRPQAGLSGREQTAVPPSDGDSHQDFHQQARQERAARVRVLAGSLLGVALLFAAQRWQPPGGAPFTGPHGWTAWLAAVCGAAGVWLVPGGWLSVTVMRTGTGPLARLATRIGVLLAWYAVVGVVVNYSAQDARVTAGSVIGVTTAATAAACLGVALGLLPRPLDRRRRFLVGAAAGGSCAPAVIWLAMRYWTYQVNYQHIRRLDWLIVLVCALLAALGQAGRPTRPIREVVRIRSALAGLAAMTAVAATTVMAAVTWPTTQHLPSRVAAAQVPTPPGVDIALALTGIGPQGSQVLHRVSLTALDEFGHPIAARFRITNQGGAKSPTALVVVVLDPLNRPTLCGPISPSGQVLPTKVTLRDQNSGMSTQAVLPPGWCR